MGSSCCSRSARCWPAHSRRRALGRFSPPPVSAPVLQNGIIPGASTAEELPPSVREDSTASCNCRQLVLAKKRGSYAYRSSGRHVGRSVDRSVGRSVGRVLQRFRRGSSFFDAVEIINSHTSNKYNVSAKRSATPGVQ